MDPYRITNQDAYSWAYNQAEEALKPVITTATDAYESGLLATRKQATEAYNLYFDELKKQKYDAISSAYANYLQSKMFIDNNSNMVDSTKKYYTERLDSEYSKNMKTLSDQYLNTLNSKKSEYYTALNDLESKKYSEYKQNIETGKSKWSTELGDVLTKASNYMMDYITKSLKQEDSGYSSLVTRDATDSYDVFSENTYDQLFKKGYETDEEGNVTNETITLSDLGKELFAGALSDPDFSQYLSRKDPKVYDLLTGSGYQSYLNEFLTGDKNLSSDKLYGATIKGAAQKLTNQVYNLNSTGITYTDDNGKTADIRELYDSYDGKTDDKVSNEAASYNNMFTRTFSLSLKESKKNLRGDINQDDFISYAKNKTGFRKITDTLEAIDALSQYYVDDFKNKLKNLNKHASGNFSEGDTITINGAKVRFNGKEFEYYESRQETDRNIARYMRKNEKGFFIG